MQLCVIVTGHHRNIVHEMSLVVQPSEETVTYAPITCCRGNQVSFFCCFFPLSDLPSRAKHFVLSMQFDHYHLMNNNYSVTYFVYFWFSACCVAACMQLCFVQTVLKLGWVLTTYLGIWKCIENYHTSIF